MAACQRLNQLRTVPTVARSNALHSTARDACAPLQSSSQRPRLTRRAPLAPARVATAARLSGGAAFAAAADITFARVTFRVPNCRLNFGEHLRVVGSCAELGSWDAAAAPMLNWQEGDCWVAELPLPPGECAFKLVVVRSDGGQQWEEGGDRRVQVPRLTALRAVCRFGDTSSMQVDGPAEPSGQVQVGAALEAIPRRASPGASSSRSRSQSPPRSRSSSSSANNQAANPLDAAAEAAAARVEDLRRGVADLKERKQALAHRMAGLEQAVLKRQQPAFNNKQPALSGSQLHTGWLFRPRSAGGAGWLTPVLLLLLFLPLGLFGAQRVGVPVESFLPDQLTSSLGALRSNARLPTFQAAAPAAASSSSSAKKAAPPAVAAKPAAKEKAAPQAPWASFAPWASSKPEPPPPEQPKPWASVSGWASRSKPEPEPEPAPRNPAQAPWASLGAWGRR